MTLWAHEEVFSVMMWLKVFSFLLLWAEPPILARLRGTPPNPSFCLSWWFLVLVLKDPMTLWSSVVSGILMWQYLPSPRVHSILTVLSPNILTTDIDTPGYAGATFLSLGLKGSVPGGLSVRQIRVKDNILSLVLPLSLPASLSLFLNEYCHW